MVAHAHTAIVALALALGALEALEALAAIVALPRPVPSRDCCRPGTGLADLAVSISPEQALRESIKQRVAGQKRLREEGVGPGARNRKRKQSRRTGLLAEDGPMVIA